MSHEHEHHHEHAHTHHEAYEIHECDGAGHVHHHHADGTCCCEAHAKEFHGIDKKMLTRLIISAVFYLAGMFLPVGETGELLLMIVSALVAGYDIVLAAGKNLLKARVFDEYFLMSFAAIAAFAIGEAEEGAAVFLLYRIGAFCQSYAIRHSRRTIASLTGEAHFDPDEEKVDNSFITRFARIYTPLILILAVLIAVILPLTTSAAVKDGIYRALTFLVLACPCAIVISVPLAYFAGIGSASKNGIFFRNSTAVDRIAAEDCRESETVSELSGEAVYCYRFDGQTEEAAGLVLRDRQDYALAQRIARRTRLIAKENVWFTILVKLAVLVLSALGISALWFAVFADSGVTVIVVLNALRAFGGAKKKASD